MGDAFNQPFFGVNLDLEACHRYRGFRAYVRAALGEVDFKLGGTAFDALVCGACAVFGGGFAGIQMAQGFDFKPVRANRLGGFNGFGFGWRRNSTADHFF